MKKYSLFINYSVKGQVKSNHSRFTEDYEIKAEEDNERLKLTLHPKAEMEIQSFELSFSYEYQKSDRIFVNGYQSWTDSREYHPDEMMTVVNKLVRKKIFNSPPSMGSDMHIVPQETKKGTFHGFSYSYIRNGNSIVLIGSVSERSGYTIIFFDTNTNTVTIKKDLEGVKFREPAELLDLAWIKDEYNAAFDRYFEYMQIPPIEKKLHSGYTTWYNYYGNVTEKIVKRDLQSLVNLPEKVDIFQIDDGYQSAIGDWLIVNEKFPSGMKACADAVHEKGLKAGLWLAPFAAAPNSRVFREHNDWLVKDDSGNPLCVGHNWGGFYALDIYNEGARAYIKHFFDVVLNEWGYDMVKLDFLYACCTRPIHNKTRGQIMCEAMDFIRECVGDKLILGCGVPLAPAFGKVDFCRIGADMGLDWRRNPFTTREDVSTPNAIYNTVFRRHLDGRAFLNDPDVFLLRDNNMFMSLKKRKLIAKVNHIFGNLLFTSDNVEQYDNDKINAFLQAVDTNKEKFISAEMTKKRDLTIVYEDKGQKHTLCFNVENGRIKRND